MSASLFSSPLLPSSTPLLATAATLRVPTPRYSLLPRDLSQSLFSDSEDEENVTVVPFPESADPLPNTQVLAERLADLRCAGVQTALDDLKSEVVALRIERDELEALVVELRRENADLRSRPPISPIHQPAALPPPSSAPPPPDDEAPFTVVESKRQRQQRKQEAAA